MMGRWSIAFTIGFYVFIESFNAMKMSKKIQQLVYDYINYAETLHAKEDDVVFSILVGMYEDVPNKEGAVAHAIEDYVANKLPDRITEQNYKQMSGLMRALFYSPKYGPYQPGDLTNELKNTRPNEIKALFENARAYHEGQLQTALDRAYNQLAKIQQSGSTWGLEETREAIVEMEGNLEGVLSGEVENMFTREHIGAIEQYEEWEQNLFSN